MRLQRAPDDPTRIPPLDSSAWACAVNEAVGEAPVSEAVAVITLN